MDKEKNTHDNIYSPVIWRVMAISTAWIVGPVIFGYFLGQFLDQRFNTEPWLLLLSLGICFILSMIALTVNALKEVKKFDEKAEDDNNTNDNKSEV